MSRLAALPFALLLTPSVAFAQPVDLDAPEHAIASPATAAPVGIDALAAPREPVLLGNKVLFVNFDGGDMNDCWSDDPQENCSSLFGGTVVPFTGDAGIRASVIQAVRNKVAAFGITVTDQRPESGDYDMEMVGNWENASPDFAGIAPNIDCFDERGGETSFTLEVTTSPDGVAEIILQELAHTWGLEHVDDPSDLLFPTTQGQGKEFQDECLKIVADTDLTTTNGWCNSMHTNFCDVGWQNSHAELLALFGPSVPDTEAPVVAIVSPTEGETIDGGDVQLTIALDDNEQPAVITVGLGLQSAALAEPVEESGAFAAPGELTFPINGLPDGTYEIAVDVTDESGNPAAATVSFTIVGSDVVPDGQDTGTDGASGDESDGGDSDAGDDAAEPDEGGSDGSATDAGLDGGNEGGGSEGCGCTTGPRGAPLALLFAILTLGWGWPMRRRR